ncbi:hypothetical protein ACR0ST_03725 [Aliidiomarina sp. Khilg15.8]
MKIVSAHPWHLVAGLVIWALWFVILYGGLGVACAIAPPPSDAGVLNWINLSLLLLTLVTAGYLATCAFLSWRYSRGSDNQSRFILRTAAAVYLTSAFATLAIGFPLGVVMPCM